MTPEQFQRIAEKYGSLRIAVIGDFCLDRYLEIDPSRTETSLETGLPVHNVVNVRAQPGGAGTILNNLAALGVGEIWPVGFHGEDGEGYELRRALSALPRVRLDHFIATPLRRTFTYCKPLVVDPRRTPRELNRFDTKNWTPTPKPVEDRLVSALNEVAPRMHALILMEQVHVANTGTVTRALLNAARVLASALPNLPLLADSRGSLRDWPPVIFKMNSGELAELVGRKQPLAIEDVKRCAANLARRNERIVYVTMSETGMVGASPDGLIEHVPALPSRGPIDIVGAGDAVTANLAAALAAGAELRETMEIAMAAASVVIHQLGTTGTASPPQISTLLASRGSID